ncbi:DNA polymerase/3'-5' exonuclease PolX [Candidatus Woesearchaeota archaeon]|nr:DNA polymerase/3'-5' exonuclease PolX [Candidatus Woesearchaeota archaeon]
MKNLEIEEILYEIADILEIQGVEFKPGTYRKAARNIETLGEDIREFYKKGKLKDIPGVGEHIAKKIDEIIETGKLDYLEKLRKEIPRHLSELLQIQSLGPKKAKILYDKLKIDSLAKLEKALEQHKIQSLEGFGEKSEQDILERLKLMKKGQERMLLGLALPIAKELKSKLEKLKQAKKIVIAGSLRRKKETIGDVDILAVSAHADEIMDYFTSMDDVSKVLAKGPTKSSVLLNSNLQVDLRIVKEDEFGAALQYFTGNKDHSIKTRLLANKLGYKLSEYGLFKGKKRIAGKTEQEIYKKLKMQCPEPEIRENTGEIEAALENKLQKLIPYNSIKGDFHTHSNYSDGSSTMKEISDAALNIGYEYICIADHSKSSRIAHGLDETKLLKKLDEIKELNKSYKKFKILKGAEVDILKNGELDYSDDILKKLDIVLASVHSSFKMPEKEMTERISAALSNKQVDILAHPTSRMFGQRPEINIDLEKIFEVCKKNKIYPEINSTYTRMDLKDTNIRKALEHGLKFCIGTDAHNANQLENIEIGVSQARRGWCGKKDIVNTSSLKELGKFFRKIS